MHLNIQYMTQVINVDSILKVATTISFGWPFGANFTFLVFLLFLDNALALAEMKF